MTLNWFNIPKTEDIRKGAQLQKSTTGISKLAQEETPKEIQHMVSPKKAVIITAVTSAVTSGTGFAFGQKLIGGRVPIMQTIFVAFGAGLLGAVTTLIAINYIPDEDN